MISVVVPVYNIENYIVDTLKSIVNQSYNDFELILVDDGCKDNSIAIAKEYLSDKQINYRIITKSNGGLSSARNEGLKNSRADYVVFIDGDDYIHVDFLSTLSDLIKDNLDFSFCDFQFIKKSSLFEYEKNRSEVYDRNQLMSMFLKREIGFVVPSMLFRREFLIDNNLYFNEDVRFSEDQMFIWDVFLACRKAAYSYSKLYGYYVRENSIMTSSSYEKIKDANDLYVAYTSKLQKKYPDSNLIKMILPRWQLGSLYTAARLMDKNEFRKLYDHMDGKSIFRRIVGIKEIKSYMLGFVCSVSCGLLYRLCRKLNLNE